MTKLALVCVLAMICHYMQAQNYIKPLTVGDTVPDITFSNLLNYPNETAKLSDFRGKAVILDFWATWCPSCISTMPEAEVIQRQFKNDLQIIMVNSVGTNDTKETVEQFLEKRSSSNHRISLMLANQDSISRKLFPHTSLPHYVWIDKNGIVSAITGHFEMTPENIKKLIAGDSLDVHLKRDMNYRKPIYIDESIPEKQLKHYSLFFKGKLFNLQGGGGVIRPRLNGNELIGILFGNSTLYSIYTMLALEIIEDYNSDPKRIRYKPSDSSGLFYRDRRNKAQRKQWFQHNVVTLELYSPSKTRKELFMKVLDELNRFSDYTAEIRKIVTDCYVLSKLYNQPPLKSEPELKSKIPMVTKDRDDIKYMISRLRSDDQPIIDRTGIIGPQKFNLPADINSIGRLTKALFDQGLLLTLEKREVQILYLTKK